MVKILSSIGYEISNFSKLVGDVRWQCMWDSLVEYFNQPNIKPDYTIIFYYSGHGILDTVGGGHGDIRNY